MKKVIYFIPIIILLSLFKIQAQSIQKEDLDFFYVGGNDYYKSIYDIRNNKKVFEDIGDGAMKYSISKDRILISNSKLIKIYNKTGKKITDVFLSQNEYLSPNWNYKLFLKDNDVWKAEFNWIDGKFSKEIRLTELGIFNDMWGLDILHWYNDFVFVRVNIDGQSSLIQLDAKNGSVSEFPFVYPSSKIGASAALIVSPLGRYLAISDISEDDYIFDIEEQMKIKLINNNPYNQAVMNGCWIDKSNFALLEIANNVFEFRNHDLISGKSDFTIRSNQNEGKIYYIMLDSKYYKHQIKESKVSSKKSFMLAINASKAPQGDVLILDLDNETKIDPEIKWKYNMIIDWIDDNTFIYVDKSDVLKQGTYLYNVKSKEKTKITSFAAEKFLILKDADKVLFRANNKTFISNISEKKFSESTLIDDKIYFGYLNHSIVN